MNTAVLLARLLLAGVLLVAGAGKLLDLEASRRAVAGFGVPRMLARVSGTLLPFAELGIAVALVVHPSSRWAAVVAVALLVVFIAGIARALARGEEPDCGCFGALHSAPAGRGQIIRNALLAALGIFVIAAGPGRATDAWISGPSATQALVAAFAVASVALAALAATLLRQRQHLRESLAGMRTVVETIPPGLPIGSPAPELAVRGLDGEIFTLSELRARGLPVALIFGVPGCGPCSLLLAEAPLWRETLAERITLGFVGLGAYKRFEEASRRTGLSIQEVYERDPELEQEMTELDAVIGSYRVHATPGAVLVTPEGTIASATVDGRLAIMALIRLAVSGRGQPGLATRPPVAA